jgi:hypothetical protein
MSGEPCDNGLTGRRRMRKNNPPNSGTAVERHGSVEKNGI